MMSCGFFLTGWNSIMRFTLLLSEKSSRIQDARGSRSGQALYGATLREDSAEADLFKLLMRDLSTGSVIRQERDVNQLGQFVRKRARHLRPGQGPTTLESAFEDTKPYVLTELGKQFVHYTMNEVVTRIEGREGA